MSKREPYLLQHVLYPKKSMPLKATLILACLIIISCSSFAHEYFVSLNGDDTNNGNMISPFKTIYKASDVAMPGDTVTVMAGEYFLPKQFKPLRSGTSSQWIVYRTAPGENVIFDGSLIKKGFQRTDSVKFSRLTEGIFQVEKVNYLPEGIFNL